MLKKLEYVFLLTTTALLVLPLLEAQVAPPTPPSSEKNGKNTKLPPCKSCRVFVESFESGMRKTERNKHDGGDAAWEEERLGSYKTSEVRLVEIQESLCNDVTRGTAQCHNLAEENEQLIEDWWFKHQNEEPDFFKFLCIDKLAVCCPDLHFGPNCDPCSDCHPKEHADLIESDSDDSETYEDGEDEHNNEDSFQDQLAGWIITNGITHAASNQLLKLLKTKECLKNLPSDCLCDTGYAGEGCTECAMQFYEAFRDEEKILCSPCHAACANSTGCRGPGSRNCNSCAKGWAPVSGGEGSGCMDINECLEVRNACERNQFCVNNEGSFSCIECDRSCSGCTGDGPDLCNTCAEGYELRDGLCTDTAGEKRDQYVTMTRYLTYLGLCIATCVIFQSSTWIASLVGLAVALYISVSEYWLAGSTSKGTSPTIPDHLLNELRGK
ncbi:cysteine-rich with EGF-like domain protein 2 [Lutzomyia longipalpis]|uniref:cysteine-rich with EGF-like domain protein 2 n=1 Tax=Lutzomyia longipalpis TaxID=7200 RepID=UPI0024840A77|nr:cysteine-rich with EGF-like domain protein 2 [Lutzomyia longipalpis]